MPSLPDLQSKLCAWDNLWLAWENASHGKRSRSTTADFEFLLADNLLQLQAELSTQHYQPGPYHSFTIHEPKKRLISAAQFRDRVVHHALCNITTPFFERQFNPDSYANRVGKGTHRALDRCQKFSRRYRYFLSCDIVQFFPAIDHALLHQMLCAMLPDDSLCWLVERILASGQGVLAEEYRMVYFPGDDLFAANRPRGLPIGNLTSQWWANAYLNPFDQFIKRELRCQAYLRYVDDFILFSDHPAELHAWRSALAERLARYRLIIHVETAYPRPVTEGIPFLGFIIYPDHRRLKRRKGLTYRRRLKRLTAAGDQAVLRASIQGWINHVRYGDTFGLRRAVLEDSGLLAVGCANA